MVLLDWTRMGKVYCLAGVVPDGGGLRVVRPLPQHSHNAPVRNVGWPADFMDRHCRWELFELVRPVAAAPQPSHVEDLWVSTLRPRHLLAPPSFRRTILERTMPPTGQKLFGIPLTRTRSAAFLAPGAGCRSLASLAVPAPDVHFRVVERAGVAEPDYRVELSVPGIEGRTLPVKDHFLIRRAETASATPEGRERALDLAVRQMGPLVVVRLGLSRAFQATPTRSPGACWLMADGFFSLADPEP
jgi:hypothetical protein